MGAKWVVAYLGRRYAAFRLGEFGTSDSTECYDPEGIRTKCLRWMMNSPLTKERAIALVNKLNGPRGDLTEI